MSQRSLFIGLCVVLLAAVAFMWLRPSDTPAPHAASAATETPDASQATSNAASLEVATAAAAAAPRAAAAEPAKPEPVDAPAPTKPDPKARPDNERHGVPLPARTIEGVVLIGTAPATGGFAWCHARDAQDLPCTSDGPHAGDARATVGADGVFLFENVEPGAYCVGVELDSGVRRVVPHAFAASSPHFRLVIRLGSCAIHGRVYDDAGAPAADQYVRVQSTTPDMGGSLISTMARTLTDGGYRVASLQPGSYSVSVELPKAKARSVLVDVGNNEERVVDFGSHEGISTWTGRVLAPDGAAMLAPWNVRVVGTVNGASQSFSSDETSAFATDLIPSRYSLLVNGVDGWKAFDEFDMPANDVVRDVTLPKAWVVVRIKREEGASDAPSIAFLSPRVQPARPVRGVLGSDGAYHFVGIPPGEYDAWLSGTVRTAKPKEPPKTLVTVTPDDVRVKAEIVVPKQ